ncbi:hypothetical protein DRN86_03390 [Candidatus Geothermarchaeota archaeon]|nr:MAG: hypothetical protein DRN86_03390 [Candidatus Geothermarchaeota archaeon]
MANQGVTKGKKLERELEKEAKRFGWKVEKRKKHGRKIQDLVLRKKSLTLVVQVKNVAEASPKDVSQAKKDYDEYINHLLRNELGIKVVPVLVSNRFNDRAKKRARRYNVLLFRINDFKRILREI